jgi:hypothetical protein
MPASKAPQHQSPEEAFALKSIYCSAIQQVIQDKTNLGGNGTRCEVNLFHFKNNNIKASTQCHMLLEMFLFTQLRYKFEVLLPFCQL